MVKQLLFLIACSVFLFGCVDVKENAYAYAIIDLGYSEAKAEAYAKTK